MLCQMNEPFLPIYDFEEMENTPDPIQLPTSGSISITISADPFICNCSWCTDSRNKVGSILKPGPFMDFSGAAPAKPKLRSMSPTDFANLIKGVEAAPITSITSRNKAIDAARPSKNSTPYSEKVAAFHREFQFDGLHNAWCAGLGLSTYVIPAEAFRKDAAAEIEKWYDANFGFIAIEAREQKA